jgi:hypothetical protein
MRSGADTLKRVTLELGGKSPTIVFGDADRPAAFEGSANGVFELGKHGVEDFLKSKSVYLNLA